MPTEQGRSMELAAFNGPNDPANPCNWSALYRWGTVALISSIEFSTNLAVLICAPAARQILADFHSDNTDQDSIILVTIWNLGGIVGMLCIGPLSEMYGRRPLYNAANVLFFLFSMGSALSVNMSMLIAFRFLNGMAIASQALNASIVGDMFSVSERGRAQSLLGVMPLLGTVAGPVAGGFLAQNASWRWNFWVVTILVGIQEFVLLCTYRESFEPAILRRKAARTQHEAKKHDRSFGLNFRRFRQTRKHLFGTLVRPFRIFATAVFLVPAICTSLTYGFLYVLFTTLTEVFESRYGFSGGAAGLSFLGLGMGMGIATYLCSATLDWHSRRMQLRHGGDMLPEWRLPLMVVGSAAMTIGLFLYGWSAQTHLHFVVPIIGTAFVGFGVSSTVIPVTTYLVDTFGDYRASAISALIVCRQAVSIVLPLAGPPLYRALGLGWGNSLLGFVSLATLPIPFLFLRYGATLRRIADIDQRMR